MSNDYITKRPISLLFVCLPLSGLSADVWIGLFANGTHLKWQNMNGGPVYTNWGNSSPSTYAGIAVVLDITSLKWQERATTLKNHALCQSKAILKFSK